MKKLERDNIDNMLVLVDSTFGISELFCMKIRIIVKTRIQYVSEV